MGAAAQPGGVGGRRVVFLCVCALGVSAIITQLVLMRELLSVLAGNEMIFGIILGNWLLLTGLGALAGRRASRIRHPLAVLAGAQILVAVLPLANVLALRTLRNVVFICGAMIGVTAAVASCFVLLLPYCLITGVLLTLACEVLAARQDADSIGQVYFLDVLGDIAGGVVFTFVLVGLMDHFRILYVPAFLNLLCAGVLAATQRRRVLLGVACAAAVGLAAVAARLDLDAISRNIEYAGRRVVYRGDSPYGSLIVTASAGQYEVISNGLPLLTTSDVAGAEEAVHYAISQRPDASRVLLIGGGASGTALEVLKYRVQNVDYVELDPLILEVADRFAPGNLADARINVINTDGRLFVRRTDRRYDVVIVDMPDPGTFQLNRFYTAEFFAEVKRICRDGGVLCISLGQYDNYVSDRLGDMIATGHHTLREVFDRVVILPGGRVFFLASDGPVGVDVADRIEAAGVPTRYVRREYLRGMLTETRLGDLARAAAGEAPVNRDFSPVLCYYHLRHWISRFAVRVGLLEGALLLAFAVYLLRLRAVPMAIFTTGFSAAGLEVVLLAGFQILYGSVYRRVGLIVTAFMVGLAAGAMLANRRRSWRRGALVVLEFCVAGYAAAIPLALMALGRFAGAHRAGEVGVALLTSGLGVLVGMEFPLAARAEFDRVAATASRLYAADLLGACAGALLVSTLLIPLIGVVNVCLLAAGLNVISGGLLLVRKR